MFSCDSVAPGAVLLPDVVGTGRRIGDLGRPVEAQGELEEGHAVGPSPRLLLAPALHLTNLTLLVVDNHSSSLPMGPWQAKLDAFGWSARWCPA